MYMYVCICIPPMSFCKLSIKVKYSLRSIVRAQAKLLHWWRGWDSNSGMQSTCIFTSLLTLHLWQRGINGWSYQEAITFSSFSNKALTNWTTWPLLPDPSVHQLTLSPLICTFLTNDLKICQYAWLAIALNPYSHVNYNVVEICGCGYDSGLVYARVWDTWMHPNWGLTTILLAHDLLSPLA